MRIFLPLLIFLVSCSRSHEQQLHGTWQKADDETIRVAFDEQGTYQIFILGVDMQRNADHFKYAYTPGAEPVNLKIFSQVSDTIFCHLEFISADRIAVDVISEGEKTMRSEYVRYDE